MEQHPQGLRGIGLSHCQESPEQKVLAVSGTGGLEVGGRARRRKVPSTRSEWRKVSSWSPPHFSRRWSGQRRPREESLLIGPRRCLVWECRDAEEHPIASEGGVRP